MGERNRLEPLAAQAPRTSLCLREIAGGELWTADGHLHALPNRGRHTPPAPSPERPEESPRRDGNGFAPASRAYETRAAARGGIPKEGYGSALLRIFDDNCRADDAQIPGF
jgi:hypothetical protein